MIRKAKSRIPVKDRNRVVFYNVTFDRFVPNETFDAAGTFFFWDCFRERQLKSLLPKLLNYLESESLFINVDFYEPAYSEKSWLKFLHFILLRALYGFFGFSTGIESTRVSDIEPVALAKGFYASETCLHEKLPVKGQVFRRKFVKNEPE